MRQTLAREIITLLSAARRKCSRLKTAIVEMFRFMSDIWWYSSTRVGRLDRVTPPPSLTPVLRLAVADVSAPREHNEHIPLPLTNSGLSLAKRDELEYTSSHRYVTMVNVEYFTGPPNCHQRRIPRNQTESEKYFLVGGWMELFLQLLDSAHNKTDWLFSDVYHLPLMDRWGPTESLFLDLRAYLRQKDVSIHRSIETFFDQLFPLVFHNNVNDPRTSEISDDYRDCLMRIRKDVYPPPFGVVPGRFAHQLAQAFSSARAFLDALRMGIRVINRTMEMPVSASCQVALTRMAYCGHCDGQVDASPCRGLCYNVMRGCLAHVTDINIYWNEMIDSLELLTVNMRGSYDIEEVLHSFHSKVSEAIMHAMETGVKFNNKVGYNVACCIE
ncbi:hypothetical protein LSH36_753g02018 [Paralvinella palmiformis]|uniref:Glypican-1 n=1 Tax=Paralvinella palmiformis TaxID=53620 RepID=A0AAD9MUE2_9ANNE|nr:hypothetical protein LSH36_753g02018 [Paralvinella palmiformis]